MPCICLVALIGLPGAGKTSLCSWLLDQLSVLHVGHVIHLCYDDFFDVKFSAEPTYKEQRENILNLIEELISVIQAKTNWPPQVKRIASSNDCSSNSENYLIMCDDNFYYRSMRHKVYQLCRKYSCTFGQIHLTTPLNICLQANETRSDLSQVPANIIRQMKVKMEVPGSEYWERNSFTIHNLDASRPELLAFLNSLLLKPAEEALLLESANKKPHDQSLTHKLDLLLRLRIKKQLEALPQEQNKQSAGRTLNNKRKDILTLYREKRDDEGANLNYYVNLLN
ncbi:L-seryl-tRNA(Sec) kinase [Drosophila ficusphila]|uniref:L-seryl-tRNA(Sec) kinase n=1 Tax=Drosophila ficusphila TaxID=30025 RepID=UPI0007E7C222|nr:L-seryl-tRNA(Sec) kinase [Drosophila ficusphila]